MNSLTVSDKPIGPDTSLSGVHSQEDRYDGSRTPPEIQYEIMRRHKNGLTQTDISRQVGCDPRTVKAVIENWGNQLHRLKLEAHKAQLIDNVILSWEESAKRGKSDSLRGWTDSLGITEPTKGNNQAQVAVQINLHGGPEPVSLAKVETPSESLSNQAHIRESLITEPMLPVAASPQVIDAQPVTTETTEAKVTQTRKPKQAAKKAAHKRKQA